jgi:transposase
MKRFIGVDLHKNRFTVCYMEENEEYELQDFNLDTPGMTAFKKTLTPEAEVAVEATGNTGYFGREIKIWVKTVRIVNPTQFKIISHSVKKTDKHDAVALARYLLKGLIPEIRLRSKEESQIASLIGTRDKLVKLRTTLKNKIHSIFNANGLTTNREMFNSEKSLNKIPDLEIEDSYKFELTIIVEQVRSLSQSIEQLGQEITRRGQNIRGHKNLTSITGIGDLSATILLNNIGDINDFSDEKKLAAYLGIVPRVSVSNETNHHGRITKMGNRIARTALVQSALIAIRYNAYLRRFYQRLKGKKGSGKAIIATARKFLVIIYRTLKNNWVFEDFNEFKLAVQT